jgi:hypothetical protein
MSILRILKVCLLNSDFLDAEEAVLPTLGATVAGSVRVLSNLYRRARAEDRLHAGGARGGANAGVVRRHWPALACCNRLRMRRPALVCAGRLRSAARRSMQVRYWSVNRHSGPTTNSTTFGPSSGGFIPFRSASPAGKSPFSDLPSTAVPGDSLLISGFST